MYKEQFSGIIPALVTPIDEYGALNEKTVRELIDWQLGQGVSGFYICGNTGEGPALPESTRFHMAEVAVEHVAGRGQVICHVGAADAQSALRLARHAHGIGCGAISSLPPTAYYDYGEDEIFDYYKRLGESCPLPLLVYANAMFRQADIAPFVERLMGLPTVAGAKFTRYNFFEMRNVCELCGGNIAVLNSPDEMLINGLTMGACAGIGSTYNVMPGRYAALYDAFTRGDFEAARQLQFEINHVIRDIIKYGVIRSIKQILCEMGFDAGGPVWPGRGFSLEEAKTLRYELSAAGFIFNP